MKPVFYPYKMKSSSAKQLAQAFGAERVHPDGKFMNNYKRPIINWGNSTPPWWLGKHNNQLVLNYPSCVAVAANKLLSFQMFKEVGVKHPEWTTDYKEALQWWGEGIVVLGRYILTGKGGEGIKVFTSLVPFLSDAKLYTKYFKKKEEYRVHVVAGKIIDFAMKKKRKGVEPNYQIRNADNGWVFCREGIALPPDVSEQAVKAVTALGLTFGAVDVGYNVAKQEACVFEVNTAPGIQGSTVDSYVKAFQELLK